MTTSEHSTEGTVSAQSKATLWATDEECPQCGDSLGPLWHLECCGLIMCDTCRGTHDEKKGYRAAE